MGEWKRILPVFLVSMLIIPSILIISNVGRASGPIEWSNDDVIQIDNDHDLIQTALNNGWQGNGTLEEPILIKDLKVDSNSSRTPISIGNTSLHVVFDGLVINEEIDLHVTNAEPMMDLVNVSNLTIIRSSFKAYLSNPIVIKKSNNISVSDSVFNVNLSTFGIMIDGLKDCVFSNLTMEAFYPFYGIYGERVEKLDIAGCSFSGMQNALRFYDFQSSIIANNTFRNCILGFGVTMANDCLFENNSISNSMNAGWDQGFWGGLYLSMSSENIVSRNSIEGPYGIINAYCRDTLIEKNSLNTKDGSIMVYECSNMKVENNEMKGGGFQIVGNMDQEIISGNYLNGKSIYYAKNSNLRGEVIGAQYEQVILQNVSNAVIRGVVSRSKSLPMDINECSNIIIEDCDLRNNSYSISSGYSDNITIRRCFLNSSQIVIRAYNQDNTTIEDCEIYSSYFGIQLDDSLNTRISGSHIDSNLKGIFIQNSNRTTIDRNRIYSSTPIQQDIAGTLHIKFNDLHGGRLNLHKQVLQHWDGEIEGNTQNGRPIYYFIDEEVEQVSIDQDGGFYYFFGIEYRGFSNMELSGEVLFQECKGISLSNISISNSSGGLKFIQCSKIRIGGSSFSTIKQGSGVFIDGSTEVDIGKIKVTSCLNGVTINDTDKCSILDSNFSNNIGNGVQFHNNSNFCSISDSIIKDNGRYGIDISSARIDVIGNDIERNAGYGVRVRYSSECVITGNHFIKNNGVNSTYDENRTQAYDMHSLNFWFKMNETGTYGNYWSDHNSKDLDEDGDGFVDSPYVIVSDEGASDDFPSVNRFDIDKAEDHEGMDIGYVTMITLTLIVIIGLISYLVYQRSKGKNDQVSHRQIK